MKPPRILQSTLNPCWCDRVQCNVTETTSLCPPGRASTHLPQGSSSETSPSKDSWRQQLPHPDRWRSPRLWTRKDLQPVPARIQDPHASATIYALHVDHQGSLDLRSCHGHLQNRQSQAQWQIPVVRWLLGHIQRGLCEYCGRGGWLPQDRDPSDVGGTSQGFRLHCLVRNGVREQEFVVRWWWSSDKDHLRGKGQQGVPEDWVLCLWWGQVSGEGTAGRSSCQWYFNSPIIIFQMTFEGIWSNETHPRDFPFAVWLTHFSDIIGGSHESNFSFWGENHIATDGFKSLAEWGSARLLETELRSKVSQKGIPEVHLIPSNYF